MWKLAVLLGLIGSPIAAEGVVISSCILEGYQDADCEVTNQLSTAISLIRYKNIVFSTDRSVPWVVSDGDNRRVLPISGGIESNETINLLFYIGFISPRAKEAADIMIEITPLSVTDANGNVIELE